MGNGEYTNGNTRVSVTVNEVVKYTLAVIAVVSFALAMKNNQETQSREIASLRVEVTAMRKDMNDWKRATTGLVFRPTGRRVYDEPVDP